MFCKNCDKELNDGAKVCPNCGTKVTLANALIDIFKSGRRIWAKEGELTKNDCFAYPQVPEDAKNLARQNFDINYDEQILFIRDTSFGDSRNQGAVITDGGIYCIPDNDKPDEKVVLPWNIIHHVEYKDLVLYFFGYENNTDNRPIHIFYFMKNKDYDKARRIGMSLAQTFTSMAQCVEPEADPFDIAAEHYDQLNAEGKHEEAFQFALSCKEQEGLEVFYMPAVRGYIMNKDYENAIALCNEGLQHCERTSPMEYQLLFAKYSAYHGLGNDIEARKFALPVLLEAPADLKYLTANNVILKENAANDFKDYDNEYVSTYLDLPYNKRKVLLPVNSYTDLFQDYLSVIDIKKLPDSGIVFPIGHPVAYQLYVGHPYIKQKYLPFESYELELIEDKVREFCQLVQCLGATEISIECLNSSSSDRNTNAEQHISGEASYVASAFAKNDRSQSRHLIDEISQSINLRQKFVPNGKPHLPEGLVWYPNEPSWQRLYNQRMQGALQQHEERIETRKNRVLEGSELNSIEGEFQSLFLAANGQWNKKIEEKFELQENTVLVIHVQFASLQELGQQGPSVNASSINQYTKDEKEYLEELKNCLEENGEISSGERRLLEKLRKHLGISEERALALEECLKPSLTEDEKGLLGRIQTLFRRRW